MLVKYGSFGLTSVKDVASAAYLASWAHSVATLPKRFPTLWESPEFLVNNMNNIQVLLDNAIVEYRTDAINTPGFDSHLRSRS